MKNPNFFGLLFDDCKETSGMTGRNACPTCSEEPADQIEDQA
jgi:hypothetical protein